MTRLIPLLFALMFTVASRAWAADPFTVAGVPVDASANTAIEAQTLAIQDGQMRAVEILIDRLTLESERAVNPIGDLTPDVVGPLIRAMRPANERRSATRYLGDISVAFNPSAMQTFLRERDLTMVSSQARERLVIVTGQTGLRGSMGSTQTLQDAFASPSVSHALTPLRAVAAEDTVGLSGSSSDDILKALAANYGLTQVLIVEPSGRVVDVALDTGLRTEFYINAGNSPSNFAAQVVKRLEADWKARTAIVAGEATSTPVSVLFNTHAGWMDLQQAINTAAQIQGARLDALAKDGALMTITYGDFARLGSELRGKGVSLEQDEAMGLILYRTGTR